MRAGVKVDSPEDFIDAGHKIHWIKPAVAIVLIPFTPKCAFRRTAAVIRRKDT